MEKKNQKYIMLCVLFSTLLVTSNVVSSKVFTLDISIIGKSILLPCGIICYPITYLITDIIGEKYGKKYAENAVYFGLVSQVLSTLIILIAKYFVSPYPNIQESYNILLGMNWIFVVGSFVSYIISQKLDVIIFHSIREKWISKNRNINKGKWIWNNVGTITSQLVDTVIYSTIAFGIGYGWLFNDISSLINMIVCQYIVKVIIALCDTPFFYLFTMERKK